MIHRRGRADRRTQPRAHRGGGARPRPRHQDVEQAMLAGYSTAPDWIRELGFGAGMGLSNIRSCCDTMSLTSELGAGTRLEMVFFTQDRRSQMIVRDLIEPLGLRVAAAQDHLWREIEGLCRRSAQLCDGRRPKGDVWVTLQAHPNVIAVAELLGLACVIVTEGAEPDAGAVARAEGAASRCWCRRAPPTGGQPARQAGHRVGQVERGRRMGPLRPRASSRPSGPICTFTPWRRRAPRSR